MKWSVIVTVHDFRPMLQECLRSIYEQHHGLDMEVVVCDQSGAYDCKQMAGDFRYVQHPKAGLADAWNAAVAEAKGEWVHLIHDDDWILPGFYTALTPHVDVANLNVVSTGYENVRDGEVTFQSAERSGVVPNWGEIVATGNPLQVPAVVFRKSLFNELGGFRERGWCTDWDLWARMALVAQWWHEPMRLARYREHGEQATAKYKVQEKLQSFCRVFRDNVENLPRQWSPQIEQMVIHYTNQFMSDAVNLAIAGDTLGGHAVFDEVVSLAASASKWRETGRAGVSLA